MKRLIVVSVLLGLVFGCGHTQVWYSPSKTPEETRLDLEECKRLAEQPKDPPRVSSRPGYPSDEGSKLKDKIKSAEDCLKEKGYRVVEKSYLDSRGKQYYDAPPF